MLLDNKRHSLKDFIEQIFNFSCKNVRHDKENFFDAALLSQKKHNAGSIK